jgi:hypothetical protein
MKKITDAIDVGFEFSLSRHEPPLLGYCASFIHAKDTCDECDAVREASWNEAGHGHTPEEAIARAILLLENKEVRIPSPEEFIASEGKSEDDFIGKVCRNGSGTYGLVTGKRHFHEGDYWAGIDLESPGHPWMAMNPTVVESAEEYTYHLFNR